jgi:hypothetical protein
MKAETPLGDESTRALEPNSSEDDIGTKQLPCWSSGESQMYHNRTTRVTDPDPDSIGLVNPDPDPSIIMQK